MVAEVPIDDLTAVGHRRVQSLDRSARLPQQEAGQCLLCKELCQTLLAKDEIIEDLQKTVKKFDEL
jgi:hypothetical protein